MKISLFLACVDVENQDLLMGVMPVVLRKVAFLDAKGHLLACKRPSFAT